MNKPNIGKLAKNFRLAVNKHSPEILTGLGIAGMATTVVLAVRATPKALELIEAEKRRQNRELLKEAERNGSSVCGQVSKLTPVDTIKTTWKCYIPAAVTGVASAACLIGANSVHVKRHAALVTAYKLSETALTEYREKVVETLGEKKEQAIREQIDIDHVKNNPVSKSSVIVTERGNTLCCDAITGRYFKSDIEHIKKVINDVNRRLLVETHISLNELYDELGLDHVSVGDDLGWNVDDGLIDPAFSSCLADDGTPCIVLNYSRAPKYGYANYW